MSRLKISVDIFENNHRSGLEVSKHMKKINVHFMREKKDTKKGEQINTREK